MMQRHPASFRDASGFVFQFEGEIYRGIDRRFEGPFESFLNGGLYEKLVERRLLVRHEEPAFNHMHIADSVYKVIKPEQLPAISYPYEWSFGQLKDAALLTLEVCLESLQHGFILKDSSGFNVQWLGDRCVFIDSLSFIPWQEGSPWIGYRQFIMHFLAPLLLMRHVSLEMNELLRLHIDGIPLALTKQMLPRRLAWHPLIFAHIYLHEKFERKYAAAPAKRQATATMTQKKLMDSLRVLQQFIESIDLKEQTSDWSAYYQATNYSEQSMQTKERMVLQMLDKVQPTPLQVLDLGANTGRFSRLIADRVQSVLSVDFDARSVHENYRTNKQQGIINVLPLRIDLTNPSSGAGWACTERSDFFTRCRSNLVLCLALVHHLVIVENVPLESVAESIASLAHHLIIEFVGLRDEQVVRLRSTRAENHDYDQARFEHAFGQWFEILEKKVIDGTERTLYRMARRTH